MKFNPRPAAALALFMFISSGLQRANSELPSLDEAPWFGQFAVLENNKFQFRVAADGKLLLTPLNEKGDPVSMSLFIPVTFGIEELLPEGRYQLKQIKPETLESAEPATDELEKTVIRGKATGDSSFELTIEQSRGVVSIGGRIVDPGSLTKNPLRFVVAARIPSLYGNDKKEEKKELKDFEKKIKGDRIELKWTDGARHKHTFEKALDASSKEVNGPGIAGAEVECEAYKQCKLLFTASPNSSLAISNPQPGPLHEGFSITWTPDTAKDPQGKARFNIQIK